MKIFKIGIALTGIAAILFFIVWGLEMPEKVEKVDQADNPFVRRINLEIDSLGQLPDSKFCKVTYNKVKLMLDEYCMPHPPQYHYGRLGETKLENEQQKENLTKNLYSVYSGKFIKQAIYVFRKSDWRTEDLNFIQKECQLLKSSTLLKRGTPIDKNLNEIQAVLNKYDEIVAFISTCKNFQLGPTGLSDRFRISDVEDKISRANRYRNNRLENEYVDKCKRLYNDLKEVPQWLFNANVSYLDRKIEQWSNFYPTYKSQKEYADLLYIPVKKEIEALDNSIYNGVSLNVQSARLQNKWRADFLNASAHKY